MSELPTDPSIQEEAAKFAAQQEQTRATIDNQVVIPNQYKGLPTGMVDKMLYVDAIHLDPAKNQELAERRAKIIEASQREEQARIATKTTELTEKYAALPEDQKQKFVEIQQRAIQLVAQAITGKAEIPDLTADEAWILDKAREVYEKQKEQNPDAPLTISFSSQTDQRVYSNLVNRLTFPLLIEQSHLEDQIEANKIRRSLGAEETRVLGDEISSIGDEAASTSDATAESATAEPEGVGRQKTEQERSLEKEQYLNAQVSEFLKLVAGDPGVRSTIENFRRSRPTSESDLQILSKMSNVMYNKIHNSGLSYQEVVSNINLPDKDTFIKDFNSEVGSRLVDTVSRSSSVRHITEEELIQGGQPEQAHGFVWFKGNAPRPSDSREVRFYVNANPVGTTKVAEYLGKLSDQLDQYGMRLQFKFRKDIGEYDRTDTCVAYLYMPKSQTLEQKNISDAWLEEVKKSLSQIPPEALSGKTPFFTEKISDGVSYVEDKREGDAKKGESYTSQITKSIAESCADASGTFDTLSEEAIGEITAKTVEKLKSLNYF